MALPDVAARKSSLQHIADAEHDIDEIPRMLAIPAPQAVRAAFDSALDLYRRLEGGDATVTSFIEAPVAEEFASDKSPDAFSKRLRANADPVDPPSIRAAGHESSCSRCSRGLDEMIARAGEGATKQILQQPTPGRSVR
ncbi:MAG: hypothetical protein U0V87_13740 [Acidobacteriota bacterium]